jgi:hypothetical protein
MSDNYETQDAQFDSPPADACPGCGKRPGEGLTPGCEHPAGCGYWRQAIPQWSETRRYQISFESRVSDETDLLRVKVRLASGAEDHEWVNATLDAGRECFPTLFDKRIKDVERLTS